MKANKDAVVATKATAEQVAAWKAAAESEGRTLSSWLRRVADLAANSSE